MVYGSPAFQLSLRVVLNETGFLNTLSAEFSFPFEELFFALKTLQLLCQVGLDREEVP
jgi:hypothetical protein